MRRRAVSGVVLTLGYDGKIERHEGMLRLEDKQEAAEIVEQGEQGMTHKPSAEKHADPKLEAIKDAGLNKAIVEDLRIIRGNLYRHELTKHPDLARDLLTFETACKMFNIFTYENALGLRYDRAETKRISLINPDPDDAAEWAKNDPGEAALNGIVEALEGQHSEWLGLVHEDRKERSRSERWALFQALGQDEKDYVLAVCVSLLLQSQLSIDNNGTSEIEAVISAINPRFEKFRPTAKIFWGRLSKGTLLSILEDMVGKEYAKGRKGLKKGELATLMEAIIKDPTDQELGIEQDIIALGRINNWVPDSFLVQDETK